MTQSWSTESQVADKKYLFNKSVCICDLLLRAKTKKSACYIKIFKCSYIRRVENNVKDWFKIASSGAIIVCLVGVSVNCENLLCGVT